MVSYFARVERAGNDYKLAAVRRYLPAAPRRPRSLDRITPPSATAPLHFVPVARIQHICAFAQVEPGSDARVPVHLREV